MTNVFGEHLAGLIVLGSEYNRHVREVTKYSLTNASLIFFFFLLMQFVGNNKKKKSQIIQNLLNTSWNWLHFPATVLETIKFIFIVQFSALNEDLCYEHNCAT